MSSVREVLSGRTRLVVVRGDCRKVMAVIPDESIDSIVCDPPYGLEFMGREWDKFREDDPGTSRNRGERAGKHGEAGAGDGSHPSRGNVAVAYGGVKRATTYRCVGCGKRDQFRNPHGCPEGARWAKEIIDPHAAPPTSLAFQNWVRTWATEALRVLKPGGHVVAFGGTRVFHRLTSGLEDAGFEVRDCLMWLYGCLTDDAEILTENGWKLGIDVKPGDRVAQWNAETGALELAPVLEHFLAPYAGPLVAFRNHDTDQLVTPNHRVYHRLSEREQRARVRRSRWTDWAVAEASQINRWRALRLPLAGVHDGAGLGSTDYAALLGWVWTEGGFDRKGRGVRIYQTSANQEYVDEIASLLERLGPCKRYDRERFYRGRPFVETCWYFSSDLADRLRADLPGKHPTFDLLWRMSSIEKRAFLDAAMKGDGSRAGDGGTFFQKNRADLEWFQTLLATVGMRGKLSMRKAPRDGGSVSITPRAETELQHRHLQAPDVEYSGQVWCVRVASGAFVARRNGLVFITGNSGFPKSLDVSKAIDKAAGAEREKIRVPGDKIRNPKSIESGHGVDGGDRPWMREAKARGYHEVDSNVPASEDAAKWAGWGTALKPAWEPIVLARKPVPGTIVAGVLEHGTGALNIDGTRVGTSGGGAAFPGGDACKCDTNAVFGGTKHPVRREGEFGRWPANVLLSHGPDCRSTGETRKIRAARGVRGSGPLDGRTSYALEGQNQEVGYGDAEGFEGVEVWECAPGCAIAELDEQSGESKSRASMRGVGLTGAAEKVYGRGDPDFDTFRGHSDAGGASRFFYCAKASKAEREAGLENLEASGVSGGQLGQKGETRMGRTAQEGANARKGTPRRNTHPTVKPLALMRWLVRLVTPPGGVVLDPFTGSGSTIAAAALEGFRAVGIEKQPEFAAIARARAAHHAPPVVSEARARALKSRLLE
jgi:site-specific DNA-methyltransferase (adenine-specific)